MDNEKLDMITKFSALSLAIGIAGFIGLIATVALFGPRIVPLMNKLPW